MNEGAVTTMPPTDGAAIAEAHRQLMADKAIQFDLPKFVPPEIPAWLRWLGEFLTSPAGKILFWIIVVLGAAIILLLVVRALFDIQWPWQRRRPVEEAVEEWRPEEGPARALLQEADALAAKGEFEEAAHLLLFRSIEDIDSRRPELVRPALTSRDIADARDLPTGPRGAFSTIVMIVEKSLFGGRRLREADWHECRSAYETFAFAEAWR